ncbi:MAG: DUF3299 domain-containing protein [Planctomycetaceae bacterium]|jgi:hypothetical protein|nr:DUF3299 domain-containing protein [Planctomycetaceae bacterium]MDB4786655.1 DUF3299 domain-containing protein [Planctomycetaceae bacterium]MDC0273237.1 DUF3299 domain-containing protein [Planctomycetaceae bacterium]MDG2391740.1 DUF3299 domain-containing protein [Planctomycetaceae bacterium]
MSQSTLPNNSSETTASIEPETEAVEETLEQSEIVSERPVPQDLSMDNEFHYKPIPVLAPVTLVLGVASLLVFVTAFGIIVGAIGAILGVICLLGILRNRSEIGGFRMTSVGLLLCLCTATYGSSKLIYDYQTEVPAGFERISFSNDIAEKGFSYEKGKGSWAIHADVEKLDGQQIFLKGFMYPTRLKEGITEFILAKDNGECCFGGEPKVTDMILIKLDKPLKVDFTDKRVSIAGEFQTNRNQSEGLTQVYEMKASYFEISKTAF